MRTPLLPIALLALLALLAVLAFDHAASGQDTARGIVFHDRNRDGARDAGEEGLEKVLVSNGQEVVSTDAKGNWSLPCGTDTIFFVIKPSGWMTRVTSDRIPRFYYIHKPDGSPEGLKVPGVAPTGPLPESIEFPLYPHEEPDRFRVLLFGDTQARGLREVNFVAHDVVEECVGHDAMFGISLGDIVADDPGLFETINSVIGQIGIPWYNVFGNHDHNRSAPKGDLYSDETFERVYGPPNYAFEYGRVVFLNFDNVFYPPSGRYVGKFREDQIAFLENYLYHVPEDRLVVLVMHIPLLRGKSREELFRVLENRPHTFSVAAHWHTQAHFFMDEKFGWNGENPHHHLVNVTACGSHWCGAIDELGIPHATMNDGAPNGYTIAEFDGNRYKLTFKAARRPADYQMNIHLPSEIDSSTETVVLVNVFAGSSRSTVEMKFGDEGDWVPLDMSEEPDPQNRRMHNLNEFRNEEVFGWDMDRPRRTLHMWAGTLPRDLPVGTHTVAVRTTDQFGQTYEDHRIVRVK